VCYRNIASSNRRYSRWFVSLVHVCPTSAEHTSLPLGYKLLSLSSFLPAGESGSGQGIGLSCPRWLPCYCMHVYLTALDDTSRADSSCHMSVTNLPALGWSFWFVPQFQGDALLSCVI